MGYFEGKTVIVTGGGKATLKDGSAGSIGYGIDVAFAKEGANLVITGRNPAKLDAAKEELERIYGIRVPYPSWRMLRPARTTRPSCSMWWTRRSVCSAASTRWSTTRRPRRRV